MLWLLPGRGWPTCWAGPPTPRSTAAQEPDPPAPAGSLAEAIAIRLKTRTEPRVAELNVHGAQVDRRPGVGQSTPSVTVTGGVNSLIDLGAARSVLVGQVGVTLGAPLWDAGASGGAATQAEQNLKVYETQLRQLGRSIPVDIEEGWNAWREALKRYDLSQDNRKNFDLRLEVVHAQLDAGVKTLTDLFTAELNASTAEFGLLKAKITAQLAALRYRRACWVYKEESMTANIRPASLPVSALVLLLALASCRPAAPDTAAPSVSMPSGTQTVPAAFGFEASAAAARRWSTFRPRSSRPAR